MWLNARTPTYHVAVPGLTLHATQMNQLAYSLIKHSTDRRGAAQSIGAPGFQWETLSFSLTLEAKVLQILANALPWNYACSPFIKFVIVAVFRF